MTWEIGVVRPVALGSAISGAFYFTDPGKPPA